MTKQMIGTQKKWDKLRKDEKITKIGDFGILNCIFLDQIHL